MNLSVATTGHDFDWAMETSHQYTGRITDREDEFSVNRHFVLDLASGGEAAPPQLHESWGTSVMDSRSLMQQEDRLTNTGCVVLGGDGIPWHRAVADATLEYVRESIPETVRITDATTSDEVIAVLGRCGLDSIATRMDYLLRLPDEDPDEPHIVFESLKGMALFLIGKRQLGVPQIGVDPDGLAHAEWRIADGGILAMEFLPSGFIRFAAVSGPPQHGVERRRVSGESPMNETMDAVRPYAARLESQ